MASDREYQMLMDKYNLLVAKYKDLEEKMVTKQNQWSEKIKDTDRVENLARELCEDILAKDKQEMVLGKEYTWNKVEIVELIQKSKRVLGEYCKKRTDLMKHIMDIADERRSKIESLEEQINIMITSGSQKITQKELEEQVENEKKKEEALKNTSYDIQKKADKGDIKVTAIRMEKEDGTTKNEEDLIKDVFMTDASFMQPIPSSKPVITTPDYEDRKKKLKDMMSVPKSHVIDLRVYIEKMNDVAWAILDEIGTNGTSAYKDIESAVADVNQAWSSSKIRTASYNMINSGIIHSQTLNLPLHPKMTLLCLTDIGQRIYKEKNKKAAVMSEVERVITDHDNAEHGYGMLDIANILRDSGLYTEVCTDRKPNTIKVPGGTTYIPDIVCKTEKHTIYVEYERGTHTQTDFNAKCNKMLNVTRYLNFVVPNKEVLEETFIPKVKRWVESKNTQSLNNVVLRINTAGNMKNCSLLKNEGWNAVYVFHKSLEPVIRN